MRRMKLVLLDLLSTESIFLALARFSRPINGVSIIGAVKYAVDCSRCPVRALMLEHLDSSSIPHPPKYPATLISRSSPLTARRKPCACVRRL
jgi:hypothetical protein